MESDFIEISGEDDSLLPLPKITNNDVSSLGKTFFSCSPLQLPRSDCPVKPPVLYHTPSVKFKGNEVEEKLDSSSHRDGVNKENINLSKPELPKLNMEPHQMKRKKKGFNMRKSLAWDRAFFTEEGVLDPLELSMISGSFGKSSGEMLSAIHEDGRDSLSGDSEKLVLHEENLLKELPSSSKKADRKCSGSLLPKNGPSAGVNAASASAAKRKVLSANDINRSGSKRSVPKPDASVISATAKSTILCTSSPKQNQIAQRAVNAQRNIGLKGSLNNSKIAQNNAKSGFVSKSMASKSSVQPARRNVVSSVLKINSSTNSQHPFVTKANNGLKINPAPELPAFGHASNNVNGGSSKSKIPLPQNVPRSAGSMQYAQPQTAKPSGLRMPSPSLSFFNQSKASHNLLQRSNQACKLESNIPNLRKFSVLNTINERSIPAPGKIANMVNNVAPGANLRLPGSSTGSSIPSNAILDSHEKMKSNLHNDDMHKVCMNVTSNCNSSDILKLQQLHNPCNDFEQQSGQHAEPSKKDKIPHVEDNESLSNDNKLLLQRATEVKEDEDNETVANVYPMSIDLSGDELENPDCKSHLFPTMQVDGVFETSTRDMIDNKCIDEKTCDSSIKNHGVFSESLYVKSCVPDVNEQSKEQSDKKKPSICQDGQISNESQRPWINNDTLSKESGSFSEFQQCNNALIADANPEAKCCSVSELEISHGPFQSKNAEEAKDCVAGVDIFSTKSQVGDVEVQSAGGMPSVGSRNNILCSPVLDSVDLMVVDDASKVTIDSGGNRSKCSSVPFSISPAVEDCSFDMAKTAECLHSDDPLSGSIDAPFSNDIKLHGQRELEMMTEDQITVTITTGDIQLSNVPDSEDFSGCFSIPSSISPAVEDCSFDMAKTADCLHSDDALSGSIDAPFSNDVKLHGQTTSGESEMMTEDQITATITTGDIQLSNVPDSGDFSGCFSIPSSLSPAVGDCSFDMAKTAESLHSDDALSGSIDAPFSNDIKLHDQTTSGESEMMTEDQITATITTGDIELSNVPDSGDFSGCELENLQHLTSQHVAMVQPEVKNVIAALQVNGGFDTKDINKHKDMEENISQNNHCYNSDLLPEDDTPFHQQSTSIVHNDGLTFMHIVNSQSEEGNELLFNKGISFEKSRNVDTGNIADISPDVKNPSGRRSESCHVLFQHEHTEKTNEEIAGADNTIKKLLVEDAQIQDLDGNISVDSCNCNLNTSAVKNKSSVCDDCLHEQSGAHSDPDPVSVQGSLDSHSSCLNDKLTTNNFSSEASQERNVCGSVMDVESRSSIVGTHIVPALKNGGTLEEQEPDYPSKVSCSFDIKTSVENPKCHTDTRFRHGDDELNHAFSVGFDVSLEMRDDQISGGAKSCNSMEIQTLSSVQNIEVNILTGVVLEEEVKRSNDSPNCKMQHGLEDGMCATEDKDGCVFQDLKFNEYKSDVLSEEAETILQKIGGSNSDMKHELEDTICAADDNDEKKLLGNSGNDKNKNDLVIKPPPYAVPFSDEWLAAFEAAGEEILTKKSGAVQNSPPEKSLPEPGPWSPVKKRNSQEIGPFDCTKKYTNANVNIPPSDCD
ncbi:hypothetical protein Dsin_020149 [Dipteronia sinensis]|uniref:Uncharacterized protein n=1 Tax=Dipteronia sinensis TaxID=43782 RepID=A0AAE0A9X2_9ROSI|nr:hypothetical protein Dsin_020149 [Dipteronia sinensis]